MRTEGLERFNIELFKLKNKTYTFNFVIDDNFFVFFEHSLIEKAQVEVDLQLQKSESVLTLNFDFKGNITLVCDRSLEEYLYPITFSDRSYLRFSDEDGEDLILRSTQILNISQNIYELISTRIPHKKIHPKYVDKDLDEIFGYDIKSGSNNKDPRWNDLKKFLK